MARQKISDAQFFTAVKKAHLNGGSNKDAIEILAKQGLTISDAVFSQRKTKLLNAFTSTMEEMAGQPSTPELSEKYRKLQEAVEFCQLERANRKSADIFDSLDGLL